MKYDVFILDTIPTDLEQATGVERKELEAILAGNPVSFSNEKFSNIKSSL